MAIVGTAYVRLRVIGDKLKKDIGDSVSKAVDSSSADLDKVGKDIGEKISKGTSKEVERSLGSEMGRISDDIGDAIGRRMAENMGRSLRSRLPKQFQDAFTRMKPLVSREGSKLGEAFSSFQAKIKKKLGSGGESEGLGGILMAALGPIITILPSVLAGAGAVIGAYLATAVTAVAMLGPAAAGAGVAAVAAFSAIKISAGLLGLAMKYPSDALTDFQKRAQTFKGLIATPIQDGLFSGLNASMRILSPVVEALKPQLAELGTVVGDIAIGFADAVRQGEMMDRIGRILATNNQFVRDAGGGVSALGQAFIILLDHLRPVTQAIGEMIGQAGNWVLGMMNAASASGQLDSWINRMWTSFTRLLGIAVDFGVGLYNVFKAAQPAAGNMMTSLEGIAARFRSWTGDKANQDRMVIFFEKMRQIVAQVNNILGDLVGGALHGLEGTNLSSLSTGLETLRSLGPPLAQMFNAIKDAAGPKLQDAFQSFADIITQLANSGVIGTLSTAFANLLAIIAQVLAIPGVGTILGWVAGLAVLMKTVGLLVNVLKFLGPVLKLVMGVGRALIVVVELLAAAFGWPIVIIAALVAALVWFFTQTEIGRKIIETVWQAIKDAIGSAVDAIVVAFNWVIAAVQSAWTWIQTAATGIWNAISTAFNAVLAVVMTVWTAVTTAITTAMTTVWNVITGIWNAVWAFLQPVLQGIWDFITSVFDGIMAVIDVAMNIIMEIWSRIWPLLMLPIRVFYGLVILIWEGLIAAITWALDAIFKVVSTVWNAVSGFITGVLNAIWNFIKMVWNGIVDAITIAVNAARTAITNVWNAIWGFIQPILQRIWDFIKAAWNGITSAVSGAMSAVWGVISSIWNNVSSFISGVLGAIGDRVSSIWNGITGAIRNAMSAVWGIITSVWNNVVSFVQGALSRIGGIITNIWGGLEAMGSGIVSGLKAAVNTVIGAVNTVIGGINWAINTANKLPGPDIPTIPTIPRLAKGGVVSPRGGGTLAMIAEAGRPERVEPLDPQGLSKRDRAMIEFLAGGAGGATNVNVYLGVGQLVPLIAEVVEEKQDGLAERVLTGTKG